MRVVQVLTQSRGGPVDHAVAVATGLARRGVESHLVAPGDVGSRVDEGSGVRFHAQEATSKRDAAGLAGLARRVRTLRPDVLHLQDRRAGWVGRGLGRVLPDVAVVYTMHGVPDGLSDRVEGNLLAGPRRRRDAWYYLRGERWVTAWGRARVVSPSRAVADFAVDVVGLPAGRVDVVPNGVDPERFAPVGDAEPGAPGPRPPRFVWLGGLVPVKRPDLVLEAVARVRWPLEVLVAGDGELAGQVRARLDSANRRGAGGRTLRLLGHVDDPAPLLRGADAFVSTSAAESCPMALLQAMSCGLPAVVTAVGGVPEVWGPVEPRTLCAAGDPDALAAALDLLAGDAALRRQVGAAARAAVLARYTEDHCLDGLLESYDRARRESR